MKTEQSALNNPAIQIAVLGAGAAVAIATAIALTEEPTGLAVGPGPDTEVVDLEGNVVDAATDEPPVVELSGNAVTAEDTDVLTGVADAQSSATSEMAEASTETPSGMETELVVDPDRGGGDGVEPDGGADPFYPTPSGPGGSDGDPLTTD